jgi:hypothetical protein
MLKIDVDVPCDTSWTIILFELQEIEAHEDQPGHGE